METASLLVQSAPGAPIGAIGPILPSETISEPSVPPLKPTKKPPASKKRKRTLSEVMTEIPSTQDVKFDPLYVPYVPVQLCLSTNFDTDNSYVIFSLFWPESMWTIITTNTNIYVVQKRLHLTIKRQYL